MCLQLWRTGKGRKGSVCHRLDEASLGSLLERRCSVSRSCVVKLWASPTVCTQSWLENDFYLQRSFYRQNWRKICLSVAEPGAGVYNFHLGNSCEVWVLPERLWLEPTQSSLDKGAVTSCSLPSSPHAFTLGTSDETASGDVVLAIG